MGTKELFTVRAETSVREYNAHDQFTNSLQNKDLWKYIWIASKKHFLNFETLGVRSLTKKHLAFYATLVHCAMEKVDQERIAFTEMKGHKVQMGYISDLQGIPETQYAKLNEDMFEYFAELDQVCARSTHNSITNTN